MGIQYLNNQAESEANFLIFCSSYSFVSAHEKILEKKLGAKLLLTPDMKIAFWLFWPKMFRNSKIFCASNQPFYRAN